MVSNISIAFQKDRVTDSLNRIAFVLLLLFLFITPFPHITSIKEFSFYSAFFLVLVLTAIEGKLVFFEYQLTKPLLLFTLWSLLTVPFAMDRSNSLDDIYSHLIKNLLLYFIMVFLLKSPGRIRLTSWVMVVSSSLFAAGGLFYYYILNEMPFYERFGWGFMEISVNLIVVVTGTACILALGLFYEYRSIPLRIVAVACMTILSITSIMTQSRAAIIAYVFALFMLFLKKKTVLLGFLTFVILAVLFTPIKDRFMKSNTKIESVGRNVRITLNLINLQVMMDHPWFGIGFGMDTYGNKIKFDKYNEDLPLQYRLTKEVLYAHTREPHNMYLSVGVRTGFIGLALFLYLMFSYVRISLSTCKSGNDHHAAWWAMSLLSAISFFYLVGLFEQGLSHITETVFFSIMSISMAVWNLSDKPGKWNSS